MGEGIYIALSGAVAQTASLDATATNLANSATDGYQRLQPVFHEVLSNASKDGSVRYTSVASTSLDQTPGALRSTGRGLDIALEKGVYLAVETPDGNGERYTRAGSLKVSADGKLVGTHGNGILDENGLTIAVPKNTQDVKISPAGEVIRANGSSLGRLRMVKFPQAEQLAHEGGTLLTGTAAAGVPVPTKDTIQVGMLEESNATVIGSMTDLVTASRTFEAFQRVIDSFREADRKIVTAVPGAA